MSKETIGEFEHLVLLAVLRLGEDAYGLPILYELRERAGRTVLRPAVYVALRRLEAKGLVSSEVKEGGARRGGRVLKRYSVEPPGLEVLRESRHALVKMWDGLLGILDT